MKTIKVAEATGPALDWLVAKCEGRKLHRNALLAGQVKEGWWVSGYYMDPNNWIPLRLLNRSTDWAAGGPIIEREITKIFRNVGGTWSAMILKDVPIPLEDRGTSLALTHRAQWNGAGPTPLIAAMRCYVTSRLGETAEVPDELI